jgi:hypothetical protein
MAKKREKDKPSADGSVGNASEGQDRTSSGQFAQGHSYSVGNKSHTNERTKALKQALLEAVSDQDMKDIVVKLVKKAKEGDIQAIKELFDRCLGRPLQTHSVDAEVRFYTSEQRDAIRAKFAERFVNDAVKS